MLRIRNDAFAKLGDTKLADRIVQGTSPAFNVTEVTNFTPAQNARIAREVEGTFTVPCYLAPNCAPGGRFQLDGSGLPTRQRRLDRQLRLHRSRVSAVAGRRAGAPLALRPRAVRERRGGGLERPGRAGQHLQLRPLRHRRDRYVVERHPEHDRGCCNDLSKFPELADRLQQGLLNELFLGRVMIHQNGFSSDPAFHVNGTLSTPSVINTEASSITTATARAGSWAAR